MNIEKDQNREERVIVMALRSALKGKSAQDFDDVCKEIGFRWEGFTHAIKATIRKEFKDGMEVSEDIPAGLALILDRW